MSHYCYDYLADSLLFTDDFLSGRINNIEDLIPVLDEISEFIVSSAINRYFRRFAARLQVG